MGVNELENCLKFEKKLRDEKLSQGMVIFLIKLNF